MSIWHWTLRTWGWAAAALAIVVVISASPSFQAQSSAEDLGAVESAFAATMADRDLDAFAGYLDEETVFLPDPLSFAVPRRSKRRGRRFSTVRRRRSPGGPR